LARACPRPWRRPRPRLSRGAGSPSSSTTISLSSSPASSSSSSSSSAAVFDVAAFDRGDVALFARVYFLDVGKVVLVAVEGVEFVVLIVFVGAERGFFLGVRPLFSEQRFAVGLRNLVIVGMDLAEGEETMTVAAEIDECRLQRGFYPGNLGEIDVALDLLVFSRFEVEFLNPIAREHRHPSFFRVARIDQHARCH
jgi:hypothetical protein